MVRWLTGQDITLQAVVDSDVNSVEPVPGDPESVLATGKLAGGGVAVISLGRRFDHGDSCWVEVIGTLGSRRCEFMMGDAGDLRLSLRHAYRGKTRCSAESEAQGTCGVSPVLKLGESQERTDVRLGWSSATGKYALAVYGNNVFDNQYVKGLNTYGRGPLGLVGATITEPRTYGMEVAVKF